MRIAALFLILLVSQPALRAATAYEAIRAVQAANGEGVLDRLVEVRGLAGRPQPAVWQVILDDPLARGGIRVVDVKNGRVASERTPVTGYPIEGPESIIELRDLNLDSSGAFVAIEKEAIRRQAAFDQVTYSLRNAAPVGTPVWSITLMDVTGLEVAAIKISAVNGDILAERWNTTVSPDAYTGDREYIGQPGPRQPTSGPRRGGEKIIDSLGNFGQRAKRHFLRDGAAVQRFFTGQSDLDEGLERPR